MSWRKFRKWENPEVRLGVFRIQEMGAKRCADFNILQRHRHWSKSGIEKLDSIAIIVASRNVASCRLKTSFPWRSRGQNGQYFSVHDS